MQAQPNGPSRTARSLPTLSETSDSTTLDLLRRNGPMSVSQLADKTEVTATAVRQRLLRLMAQDLVQRTTHRSGRGRPSHRYSLTERARRQAGNNFGDLAMTLWQEIRAIDDPAVRRGLLRRVATSMAEKYAGQVKGDSLEERMRSLAELFAERDVPVSTKVKDGQLPVLSVDDCPYPELAEQDRGICAVEKMVFSELLDDNVRLTQCRLDGETCCTFEMSSSEG